MLKFVTFQVTKLPDFIKSVVMIRDFHAGGCGAMFEIYIETPEFKGLSTVKQHRLVTEALRTQIKEMHGVRIHTKIPDPQSDE